MSANASNARIDTREKRVKQLTSYESAFWTDEEWRKYGNINHGQRDAGMWLASAGFLVIVITGISLAWATVFAWWTRH